MKYCVLDVETTMRCPVGNFSASPHWPDNQVVLLGVKTDANTEVVFDRCIDHATPTQSAATLLGAAIRSKLLLVGHNIKFDLLYLLKDYQTHYCNSTAIKNFPEIWDTQLAEYLLTGQQTMYASLDEVSTKYGGTIKDSYVSDCFKKGIPTETIDDKVLREYLKNDVLNTELVFQQQIIKAQELGVLDFIKTQMAALRATTLMAWHGMQVDYKYVEAQSKKLASIIEMEEEDFNTNIDVLKNKGLLPKDKAFQIGSNKDLSMVFFGGEYVWKEKEAVGLYKNGNTKYASVEKKQVYPGCTLSTASLTKNKLGYYPVDHTYLETLVGRSGALVTDLVKGVLNHRECSKQRETYYENLKKLRFFDKVHPNVSHVSTKTGRLSCSEPNLQNQTTDGGVKKAFVSRFKNGKLLELDYSQLEMVALGVLSGDKQLLHDLATGVDMHSELYKGMYGRYPTKDERKPFKRLSFGLVYGAGYKTLALNAKCTDEEAKRFIEVFYSRYVGVADYHASLKDVAKRGRKPSTLRDAESGLPIGTYTMESSTGRRYVFKEYANKIKWGRDIGKWETSFSPPELKNWPVQGFATGDIVPMMVGILDTKLRNVDKCVDNVLLVMTVHDSVLLDVNCDEVDIDEVAYLCKTILEDAPKYVETLLHTPFPVPLKVEATCGTNWLEQTPIDSTPF